MVCYNHNPQGVSFESCATHFLCSDAPEPAPSTHRRQSVGTGQELAQDELAQHMVGGLYRWRSRGLRFENEFKFRLLFNWGERARWSCFFIGFANWWPHWDYEPIQVESHVLNTLITHTQRQHPPQTEIIARERILWAHKRLVLYYNFALASRQEDALRLINTLFELRFYCFNYVSEWARANWQNNLCFECAHEYSSHTLATRNGVRATSHLSSRAH